MCSLKSYFSSFRKEQSRTKIMHNITRNYRGCIGKNVHEISLSYSIGFIKPVDHAKDAHST